MPLSNGIMRFITRISKFSCGLYSVKIVCIRSDAVLKSRLLFAKCCHTKDCCLYLRSRSQFHFVQTRTEKFLHLTLVMKCRFFATSRILFRKGQCFSNFFIPSPLFTLDTSFSPPSLIKRTQGSKLKNFI